MLIGITGRAGAGKDTAARCFAKRGWAVKAIADPMKEFCAEMFGWRHDRLWGPSELRNEPDPRWGGLSARRALQTLGTEWGRNACHPDVWAAYTIRRWQRGGRKRTVISDVRFDNEVGLIRSNGGIIVEVVRPSAAGHLDPHVSEAGVHPEGINHRLENIGVGVRNFEIYVHSFIDRIEVHYKDRLVRVSHPKPR